MLELRDYQKQLCANLLNHYRQGGQRPVGVLPTGGGKTVVFSHIAASASSKGNRIWIVVHRDFLIDQTCEKLVDLGVPHGVIAPGAPETDDLVQVVSVFTAARRLHRLIPPKLIIIDECHHAIASQWVRLIEAFPAAKLLGVTATPERLDGRGLGSVFDGLIVGPSVAELIARGFLAKPLVFTPPEYREEILKLKRRRDGEIDTQAAAEFVVARKITGNAIEQYEKLCPGVPAVTFCATIEHAEQVAAEFRERGIPSVSIDGTMSKFQRKAILRDFAGRAIKNLTSCELIGEGFDLPEVVAAILLRPTMSTSLALQQMGRALRIAPGKEFAFILDHVGNCFLHGLPQTERNWSLEGKKKRLSSESESSISLLNCPRCFMVFPPALNCPFCGEEIRRRNQRELKEVDGDLIAVDMDAWEEARQKMVQKISAEQRDAEARKAIAMATSLDDLLAAARRLNYKPQWAYKIWQWKKSKEQSA